MLKERILELKRLISDVSSNPILNSIEVEECERIDLLALSDSFISKRRKELLNLTKGLDVDFDGKYKSVYDLYSEMVTYSHFVKQYDITAIPEGKEKTPDFKVVYENKGIYIELKSMAFSNGNLNYQKAQNDALESKIQVEEGIKKGKKMAFGIYSINPLRKEKGYVSGYSVKYVIDQITSKIDQNIKPEQFSHGDTILMVDLKQLIIPSSLEEASVPFFVFESSIVSGVLWNVAFGRPGNMILKTIEFEGKENVEGYLDSDGILVKYEFIKAIIFVGYRSFKGRQLLGFFRAEDEELVTTKFIADSCNFTNNDANFYGFRVISQAENETL